MSTAQASGPSLESRQTEASLDRQYGRIAISAVVAALPYRSEAKSQSNAPVKTRD
jgi:hypothetical protein